MRRNELPHLLPGLVLIVTVVAYMYASVYYSGKGCAMGEEGYKNGEINLMREAFKKETLL